MNASFALVMNPVASRCSQAGVLKYRRIRFVALSALIPIVFLVLVRYEPTASDIDDESAH